MTPEQLMTTSEVAAITRTPASTLRFWRYSGTGPKSFKVGPRRVMYRRADVEKWLDDQYNAERVG